MATKRVFIQGTREPDAGEKRVAIALGKALAQAGWEANLGAFGGLVKAFEESGVKCHVHLSAARGREVQYNEQKVASVTNCVELANQVMPHISSENASEALANLSWGIRFALLQSSDAFIFWGGAEGTLAHAVPIIATIKKHGGNKKVVLVGWSREHLDGLFYLGLWDPQNISWIRNIRPGEIASSINRIVDFITT